MFRIEKQDGLARLGELNGAITPHMIDLRSPGELADLVERRPPEVARELMPEAYEALVREGEVRKLVLTSQLPRSLVERIVSFRKSDPSPLYLPSLATPQNASLLIYLGADIVDNAIALRSAAEGVYLTESGSFNLSSLNELPCRCRACESRDDYDSDFHFLTDHNTIAIEREVRLARAMLKAERLRELVEVRAKANPETTAMLRIVDSSGRDLPFARFRRSKVYPTSEDSFARPEIAYYFERMLEIYSPSSPTALLIPCSARKPYSLSKTHRELRSRLGRAIRGVNEIIISSPFVAPRELELTYPILSYDTPTTGMWSEWEVQFVAERLAEMLTRFESVVAFLHGGYRRVAEKAGEIAGKDIVFVEDYGELRRVLERSGKVEFDLYHEIFRHMLSYQFGVEFEVDGVRGRYPNLEYFSRGERVARVDVRYGNLDIYGKLAEFLVEQGIYAVRIDEFDVKGMIFSRGVIEADEKIRPNDVVVYYSSSIFGVGQAVIPGSLMGEVDGKAVVSRRKYRGGV
ncbi:tRNA-archaeosine synthase [Geoglobus ahangari]|uniref:tRNA-archaeosine synthase n=1 Tax=Geoglobus ahangari TaxID=113653 RepID=A0A0F7IGN9_9EURY|nr:archaeosine synthase subunit alpha [Geoglobus ahangari]AKG92042.1 tRNA-archaeosine synthase [Geoglobus ahangari]